MHIGIALQPLGEALRVLRVWRWGGGTWRGGIREIEDPHYYIEAVTQRGVYKHDISGFHKKTFAFRDRTSRTFGI